MVLTEKMMQKGLPVKRNLPGVKRIVLVASGKGGTGKSTTAVNLAVACASSLGLRTGLLDADIFGPSLPKMMNLPSPSPPLLSVNSTLPRFIPWQEYGVKCMSMGFLVGERVPVVWRGMMVSKAIQQLMWDVEWGELDVLFIDTPPGTGDIHLSLAQHLHLSGAVVVTTPQGVALGDVAKGVEMLRKVGVPILGLVQNMSYFQCPCCQTKTSIFSGHSTTPSSPSLLSIKAKEMNLQILAEIPLSPMICDASDEGVPMIISSPNSELSKTYVGLTEKIVRLLKLKDKEEGESGI